MAEGPSEMAEGSKLPAGTMEVEKTAKDYYFDSYSHFGIHEEMLKDYVRTDTYRRSIVDNKHLFQDKIVLDVGCGTGILSMFAAEAGAKHVYGVDCADIVKSARMIVAENGFADRITIIQGKVEEISLPVEKVDIIISEWMGYFLLYESMMDTVLMARDKWLAPGGLLFPDKARMHICAIEDENYRRDKLDYWDNVYGFKMSCIKATAMAEPLVDVVPPSQITSSAQSICEIDLYTVTVPELDFASEFEIVFNRKDMCHGLTAWFDVQFSKCHVPVGFTTAPFADYTHWKQTVFYIKKPFAAEKNDVLKGKIDVRKNPNNHRDLNITLNLDFQGQKQEQSYIMR